MPTDPPSLPRFLTGGGQLARLIADFNWAATPVGALSDWPGHMKAATALMVHTPVPIVMLWGETGVMIYNDAYAVFAGSRHPSLLGSRVREGWPEVADFNDHVMTQGLAGRTLSYTDQELVLTRDGTPKQAWMNLDYSPLLDELGVARGVMAIVVETTAKVRAERHLQGERERLARLFDQAPSFMAMLAGPDHVFELVNPAYLQLIGHRQLLGLPVVRALPDAVAQGYLALLDQVYTSGQSYTATSAQYAMQVQADGPIQKRFVDFVFQPIRDANGAVTGIFVEGVDVTERIAAEDARRASEARLGLVVDGAKDHAILTTDAQGRVLDWSAGAEEIFGWTAAQIVGQPVDLLFTPEDRANGTPARELLTAARDGCANDERWHLRKDGSPVFMNGTVRPLPAGPGRPGGFLRIARDETSEHRVARCATRWSDCMKRFAMSSSRKPLRSRRSACWARRSAQAGSATAPSIPPRTRCTWTATGPRPAWRAWQGIPRCGTTAPSSTA